MVMIIIRLVCALTICGLAIGCAHTPENTIVRTVQVKVPVSECPASHLSIKKPSRPSLAIDNLTESDEDVPGKVAQAYKVSIKQLQGYALELENGFKAYRDICTLPANERETKNPEGELNQDD